MTNVRSAAGGEHTSDRASQSSQGGFLFSIIFQLVFSQGLPRSSLSCMGVGFELSLRPLNPDTHPS